MQMALDGLRILEIGSLPAASYCARLFADFGADVVKIEAADDALRHAAPIFDANGLPTSAWHTFLNFGKRHVLRDGEAWRSLAADCDVLVCGDVDAASLGSLPASLVVIDTTWFGRAGPYSTFKGTDAICRALGGNTQLVGPKDGPPLPAPDFQAAIAGGLWAFIAASSALIARARDGGRTLGVSVHESCVTLAEYQVSEFMVSHVPQTRLGINRFAPTYPLGIYPTQDDWLGVTLVTPAQWRGFCDMLGMTAYANDPNYATSLERLPQANELEAVFIPKLREKPAAHWFAEALRRKLPAVVVPTVKTLIASDDFRARGAVVPVDAGGTRVMAPGSPFRLRTTPPRIGGTLDMPMASASWRERDAAPVFAAPHAPKGSLPLAGLRIVDFTMGWAGPLCTRTLADLGADVVKIEGCGYPDWWRGVDRRPHVLREMLYERQGRFAALNRNKRGITLDLTRPEGVRLAKALVMKADAVADNYSVDVLPKFGLGPDVLRALKPGLVTLSMSAFGASSPWRDCRAYGSTLEQGSGLPRLIGDADGDPVMGHPAYGDPIGGLNGAAAILTALLHARRTGEGQHIDLSQVECMMQMTAPWMIAFSASGEEPARYGRGHPDHAPHNVYRCAGDEAWLAIAVRGDAEWRVLCTTIGRADLGGDPRFATAQGRRAGAAEIDAAVGAWTMQRSPDDAMRVLQDGGVAAGVVRRPCDLLDDPHLSARGFWQMMHRDYIGLHPQPSPVAREGTTPYRLRTPAPMLGEQNRDVLGGLLGLGDAEIAALERSGVIGTEIIVDAEEPLRRANA